MLNLKEFVMWAFLVMSALGLAYTKGHSDATTSLTLEHKTAQLAAARQLEVEREAMQKSLGDISKNWAAYKAESDTRANTVLRNLRDSGIRLQVKLNDSLVSCVTSGGRPIADGYAELHRDTSKFLIEQAQRADAQVIGLQETVRALQGGPK